MELTLSPLERDWLGFNFGLVAGEVDLAGKDLQALFVVAEAEAVLALI
jgi:hypothetical protein